MAKAIVMLHNYFIKVKENHFDIIETVDVGNNSGLVNLGHVTSNNHSKSTKQVRKECKEYFSSGGVFWQNNKVTRTD